MISWAGVGRLQTCSPAEQSYSRQEPGLGRRSGLVSTCEVFPLENNGRTFKPGDFRGSRASECFTFSRKVCKAVQKPRKMQLGADGGGHVVTCGVRARRFPGAGLGAGKDGSLVVAHEVPGCLGSARPALRDCLSLPLFPLVPRNR